MPKIEQGQVRIRKRAAARIRNGHLWVYRSDILGTNDVPPGAVAAVHDERNAYVGKAFYSSQSQIALRFLTRRDIAVDEAFFQRRIEEADALRLRAGIDPYISRRIFSEGDLLPGLIVDRYGDYLIVQTLTQGADRLQSLFSSLLQQRYQPRTLIFRNDTKMRELEGLPISVSWAGDQPQETVLILENGKQMEIPIMSGQKTGAFLDQRASHIAASRYAGGRVLDCFCYAGGFALQVADRSEHVTAIDSSSAAVQLTRSNAARNGLQNIEAVEANVFDFLRDSSSRGEQFDLIILDPPAFARSKETLDAALRGYKEINNRAMRLLRNGGCLITCSCSHHVSEGLFAEMLAEAARDAGRWLRVLERRLQSPDHPVLLAVPETLYLKCFIFEVLY